MTIKAYCRGCEKTYQVKDALAGKRAKCPKGHVFVIPTLAPSPEDPAPQPRVAVSPGPPQKRPSNSTAKSPIMGNRKVLIYATIGGGLALVLLIGAVYSFVSRPGTKSAEQAAVENSQSQGDQPNSDQKKKADAALKAKQDDAKRLAAAAQKEKEDEAKRLAAQKEKEDEAKRLATAVQKEKEDEAKRLADEESKLAGTTDLPEPWQRDWREFGKRLQDAYSKGQADTIFAGQAVQWTGTRIQAGSSNWIELRMEAFQINLGKGDSATVSSVTLVPTKEEEVQWRSVALGQQVVFRTKFRTGKSVEGLGPIAFVQISNKWQPLMGVKGAQLIRQVPVTESPQDFGKVVTLTGVIRSKEATTEIEFPRGVLTLRWLTLEVAGADPKSTIEYQLEGSETMPQNKLQDLTNKTVRVTGTTSKSNFSGCKAKVKVDSVTVIGTR